MRRLFRHRIVVSYCSTLHQYFVAQSIAVYGRDVKYADRIGFHCLNSNGHLPKSLLDAPSSVHILETLSLCQLAEWVYHLFFYVLCDIAIASCFPCRKVSQWRRPLL